MNTHIKSGNCQGMSKYCTENNSFYVGALNVLALLKGRRKYQKNWGGGVFLFLIEYYDVVT